MGVKRETQASQLNFPFDYHAGFQKKKRLTDWCLLFYLPVGGRLGLGETLQKALFLLKTRSNQKPFHLSLKTVNQNPFICDS